MILIEECVSNGASPTINIAPVIGLGFRDLNRNVACVPKINVTYNILNTKAYTAKRVLCLRQTGSAGWLVQKWRHQIYEITHTSHSFRSLALFKLTYSSARLATCRDDGLLKPVHISDISPRVFPIPSLAHGDNIQQHNQGQKLNNHRHTYWKWDSKNSYSRTIRAAAASADNWWWRRRGARK